MGTQRTAARIHIHVGQNNTQPTKTNDEYQEKTLTQAVFWTDAIAWGGILVETI